MELMLQYGSGMKQHSIDLIRQWGGGTVVLSPKHLTLNQMVDVSSKLNKSNGKMLIDPQFYIPRGNVGHLSSHKFWPSKYDTATFFTNTGILDMLKCLLNEYNLKLNTNGFIIPSLFLDVLSEDWLSISDKIINAVDQLKLKVPKYFTLCLGAEVLRSEEVTHSLLEEISNYPVDGFYIIPVHPGNLYLVEDAAQQLNLLDFVAGLKLKQKKVIVGYTNHQSLLLALAKVDAICAGIWIKTRMFPLDDYIKEDDKGGGRKSTWYYCPQALSEYQIFALDIAKKLGCLDLMRTSMPFNISYSANLFLGPQPSTVEFTGPQSYRHYLECLKTQCSNLNLESYDKTYKYLKLTLETAFEITNQLRGKGIRGKHRDYNNVAENSLGILDSFDSMRGFIYKTKWNSI